MSNHEAHGRWIIYCSFIVALALQIMPWPEQIYSLRPSWLMLFLLYWVIALPYRVNIGTGLVIGLVWDLTTGTMLGVHALALSIVTYLASLKFQLIRNMALWQQALVIIFMSVVMDGSIFLMELFLRKAIVFQTDIIGGCLVNGLLWPWLFLLLRKVRRKFGVR